MLHLFSVVSSYGRRAVQFNHHHHHHLFRSKTKL